MGKALVVYTTRSGETRNIAQLVAEGIRFAGAEAKVVNVTEIKTAKRSGRRSPDPDGNGAFRDDSQDDLSPFRFQKRPKKGETR